MPCMIVEETIRPTWARTVPPLASLKSMTREGEFYRCLAELVAEHDIQSAKAQEDLELFGLPATNGIKWARALMAEAEDETLLKLQGAPGGLNEELSDLDVACLTALVATGAVSRRDDRFVATHRGRVRVRGM